MEIAALQALASVAGVVSSLAGVAAQQEQASLQAQRLRIQAEQAKLQGRQNALNYAQQANRVFDRQQQLAATARARAAAGGIDPWTGSPMSIQQADAFKAGKEFQILSENAQLALYGGLAESQSLRAAAGAAESVSPIGGLADAFSKGLMGFSRYQESKLPPTPAPMPGPSVPL
jgi:hypothetical protein